MSTTANIHDKQRAISRHAVALVSGMRRVWSLRKRSYVARNGSGQEEAH